jgi:hypothetical protein
VREVVCTRHSPSPPTPGRARHISYRSPEGKRASSWFGPQRAGTGGAVPVLAMRSNHLSGSSSLPQRGVVVPWASRRTLSPPWVRGSRFLHRHGRLGAHPQRQPGGRPGSQEELLQPHKHNMCICPVKRISRDKPEWLCLLNYCKLKKRRNQWYGN